MSKLAITNARYFDDQKILPAITIVIENGVITRIGKGSEHTEGATIVEAKTNILLPGLIDAQTEGAAIVDAENSILIPGLIDARVHLHGLENLQRLLGHGVMSACDMATWPPALATALRNAAIEGGFTGFKTPGIAACAPNNLQGQFPGFLAHELVSNPEDAAKYGQRRFDKKVDYIKVMTDLPGFDQATLNALVTEEKQYGKQTITHAAQVAVFERAVEAKIDVITHTPMDKALDSHIIEAMLVQWTIAVPTLIMMESIMNNINHPRPSCVHATDSVTAMYRADIPIH